MIQSAAIRYILLSIGVLVAITLVAASWLWPAYYATKWIGLCLLFVLAVTQSPKKAFIVGAIVGGGAIGIAFQWVPEAVEEQLDLAPRFAWLVFAAMLVYEAIPFGLLAMLASRSLAVSVPRMWGLAVVWVVLEVYWPRIFPWSLAHSQTGALPLLQLAEVIGAPGISFVMIAVTVIPAAYIRRAALRQVGTESAPLNRYSAAAIAMLVAVVLFGWHRLHVWEAYPASRPAMRIALVQVDPNYSDSIEKMRGRSLGTSERVDLICWPESTLGNYCSSLTDFASQKVTLAKSLPPLVDMQPAEGLDGDLLAGGKLFDPGATDDGPFFQTGFLIHSDQTIGGRYLKRTLMPIGEYVPGESLFPSLRHLVGLQDTIVMGGAASPLELSNGIHVGVLMCYDDMVPANARKSVAEGAQILVTLANGTAFTNPLALEQHMRLALLRSVENRRYFARCAASGVSCIIAPTGAITQRVDTNVEATLTADVALLDDRTIYSRFGFLFAPACLTVVIVWLLWASWDALRRKPREPGDAGLRVPVTVYRSIRMADGNCAANNTIQ